MVMVSGYSALDYVLRYTSKYDNGNWHQLAMPKEQVKNERMEYMWKNLPYPHVL